MILFIGGKQDGKETPHRDHQLSIGSEAYILLEIKEKPRSSFIYMLAGMAPAEAIKIFRERAK
jgi:hypothetical protein